jgi:hypothetical protein
MEVADLVTKLSEDELEDIISGLGGGGRLGFEEFCSLGTLVSSLSRFWSQEGQHNPASGKTLHGTNRDQV